MRSDQFSYRSESSKIRGTREKPQPVQSTDWGRTIYLGFLALVALVLIYYAVSSYITLDGDGKVITGDLTLRAPTQIKVSHLFHLEGNRVEAGDSLFAYTFANWQQNLDSLKSVTQTQRNLHNELGDVKRELALTRQKLEGARRQLTHLEKQKKLVVQEIRLDVQSPARIHDLEQQIVGQKNRISVLAQEQKNLKQHQSELQSDMGNIPALTAYGKGRSLDGLRIFRSPVSGHIRNIYANEHGILMNAERILTLVHDTSEIMIRASFTKSSVAYLREGQKLTINFDNGVTSKGILDNYYMAHNEYLRDKHWTDGVQPDEDIYTTTDQFYSNRRVIVELKPLNPNVEDVWRANEHIGLDVILKKVEIWPTISP